MKNIILLSGLALALISCINDPDPAAQEGVQTIYEGEHGGILMEEVGDSIIIVVDAVEPEKDLQCGLNASGKSGHSVFFGERTESGSCRIATTRHSVQSLCRSGSKTTFMHDSGIFFTTSKFCEKYND
jgi:hypothetical protein